MKISERLAMLRWKCYCSIIILQAYEAYLSWPYNELFLMSSAKSNFMNSDHEYISFVWKVRCKTLSYPRVVCYCHLFLPLISTGRPDWDSTSLNPAFIWQISVETLGHRVRNTSLYRETLSEEKCCFICTSHILTTICLAGEEGRRKEGWSD